MSKPWIYNGEEITNSYYEELVEEGYIGFVYMITDSENNKKYIGKKLWITKRKMPPLKGKKRKRTKMVETDWRKYHGSNKDIQLLAEESDQRFEREILHLCKSKGELSYVELVEQVERKVLLRDDYYNGIIQCRINSSHIKDLHLDPK